MRRRRAGSRRRCGFPTPGVRPRGARWSRGAPPTRRRYPTIEAGVVGPVGLDLSRPASAPSSAASPARSRLALGQRAGRRHRAEVERRPSACRGQAVAEDVGLGDELLPGEERVDAGLDLRQPLGRHGVLTWFQRCVRHRAGGTIVRSPFAGQEGDRAWVHPGACAHAARVRRGVLRLQARARAAGPLHEAA